MARRRDDLLIGTKEKAIEAVKAGKKDEAIKYIEQLSKEFQPLHDRYGDWLQILLTLIAERLGEEAVEEAFRTITLEIYKDRWVSLWKNMSPEEIVEMLCQVQRSHYNDFYVEEDDEKFVIVIPYCGSGGRIQKSGRGGSTKKAYPWSFDEKGVIYYCCHESVFNTVFEEIGLDSVKYEYSQQFDKDGKPTGGACRWVVYKKNP